MKPFGQSNSMKELLKKLKRHDTLVMAAGVVAATILCGVFVYVTTPAISADAAAKEVEKDSLGVQKKASEQLSEIDSYLERLDQVVTNSQNLVSEIEKRQTEINNNSEHKETETNNTNSTKVVEKISGLDKELASIHDEIKNTSEQVKNLTETFKNGGSGNNKKDNADLSQISNALDDIKKSCDKSGDQISGLVASIKTGREESDKKVLGNLEKIEQELGKVNSNDTLTRLESELSKTQGNYSLLIKEMEKTVGDGLDKVDKNLTKTSDDVNGVGKKVKKVEEHVDSVDTKMGSVEEHVGSVDTKMGSVEEHVGSVENKMGSVEQGVNDVLGSQKNTDSKIGEINSSIEGVEGSISDINKNIDIIFKRLDESFKKVADEKKKLASTLATLGVDIENTENGVPTFDDIDNAIRKLPTKIKSDAQFEYIKHSHKDKNGNVVNGETCPTHGGCFTQPVYHTHSDGCYKIENTYYVYRDPFSVTGVGIDTPYCEFCGKEVRNGHIDILTKRDLDKFDIPEGGVKKNPLEVFKRYKIKGVYKVETKSTTVLTCTKGNTHVDGYRAGCGHKSGEIIEVRIKYDKHDDLIGTSLMSKKSHYFDGMVLDSETFTLDEVEEYNSEIMNEEEEDAKEPEDEDILFETEEIPNGEESDAPESGNDSSQENTNDPENQTSEEKAKTPDGEAVSLDDAGNEFADENRNMDIYNTENTDGSDPEKSDKAPKADADSAQEEGINQGSSLGSAEGEGKLASK